ncbi:MAG: hypothetical protein IIA85_00890 [Nanoarchaeota archaeon]|nr:hypothetical protein [Nanoarchaeota archaeon]
MGRETKYGVISDIHKDPRIASIAVEVLKSKGAEKLLVNGDIGDRQTTLEDTRNYTAIILDAIAKSGLESFVQPGSHEALLSYGVVMDQFAGQYSNIIDTTRNQEIDQDGHKLVFLPGSDFLSGGEYQIGSDERIPSGRYIETEKGLLKFEKFEEYALAMHEGIGTKGSQYFNMNDLRKMVTQPEKTIIVCHVPRKFDNLETTVDMAEFWEATEDFYYKGNEVKKGSVYPLSVAKPISDAGYPIILKRENRGNEDLRDLYEEIGITKAVTGHFHESGHRANDRNGNHVQEGAYVNDLFWNSGHLDVGQTGILTVNGNKVSYENIRLQDYSNQ